MFELLSQLLNKIDDYHYLYLLIPYEYIETMYAVYVCIEILARLLCDHKFLNLSMQIIWKLWKEKDKYGILVIYRFSSIYDNADFQHFLYQRMSLL